MIKFMSCIDGSSFAGMPEGAEEDFVVRADPPDGKAPPARDVWRRVAA
ncbi:MAG: hypothetical protein IT347_06560 [Candidatus Eisenbacteria bacterium]|nr:hypothetical protein [Candidatus Eisenbacteria bacterium]